AGYNSSNNRLDLGLFGKSPGLSITNANSYVGIGTTAPAAQLHVVPATASVTAQVVQGKASQTGNLTEWQNSAGTAMTRVDPNGYLGIGPGAATPAGLLDVAADAVGGSNHISYTMTTNASGDPYNMNLNTGPGMRRAVWTSQEGTYYQAMAFSDGGGLATDVMFGISASSNSGASWQPRFAVMQTGNVGIGTKTPSYTLHVNGSVAGTGAYNALSDIRLKTNIKPLEGVIEKLAGLHGITYTWKDPVKMKDDREQIGFIAQDVKKVFPQAVTLQNDGFMSVAYSMIIPPTVEAVKLIYAKVLQLEANFQKADSRVAALEKENELLKKRSDLMMSELEKMKCDLVALKQVAPSNRIPASVQHK
ncbi:MAG: tail fiber domain-containing protein, partial [Bdellovibrionales bacterium]|nr:tail fiber domain-containing protein [Oligoflexia bacterium]